MRPAVPFLIPVLFALAAVDPAAGRAPSRVHVIQTPEEGVQPQAVVDERGVIHLIFFKGEPSGGDLFYVKLTASGGALKPSAPTVRVNSVAGSALATGTVRGAQIALGRNRIVHVAWHGSKAIDGSGSPHPPVWYARSTDGAHFDAQRTLSGAISGIDGSTVAAGNDGRVAVAWHGMGTGPGEDSRTVYLANSTN